MVGQTKQAHDMQVVLKKMIACAKTPSSLKWTSSVVGLKK